MKLKRLIKDLPLKVVFGSPLISITGISSDSRLVAPGNLFIARRGTGSHGGKFIDDVVRSGAAAILTDLPDPSLTGVTQLYHPYPEQIEAELSAAYHDYISSQMVLVGITGTNGKTTCAYLMKFLLDRLGKKAGLIGTVEWLVGDRVYPSLNTTPDIHTAYRLLREMKEVGCSAAVMEVSSHGLSQGRTKTLDFDIAIFTNLSQDHLDYHGNMEAYGLAKSLFFKNLGDNGGKAGKASKVAIINNDDPKADLMASVCREKVMRYGLEKGAELFADELLFTESGVSFTAHYLGKSFPFNLPLIGRFNVSNALAVIGAGLALGESLGRIAAIMRDFPGVNGRLERVENEQGKSIYVDYAHTPDALEKTLKSLREFCTGKLWLVFGCGGDRDRDKRAKMGRVAGKYADFTFVTSDNPRGEDPKAIGNEIITGFEGSNYTLILDRADAIRTAVQAAAPGDHLLIAGKGHERIQTFARTSLPFDDRLIVKEVVATQS